jgi:hypothetical protein
MRLKDLKSGQPLLPPDYIVLDAKSFVFESEFTGEKLFRPYAERTLTLLSTSYNYISLIEKREEGVLDKLKSLFKQDEKMPHIGKLIELPFEDWRKLLEEYDTLLLYYGEGSTERIHTLPSNRRLKYSPDPRILDTVVSNYRLTHTINRPLDREEISKTKRSKIKRIQSGTRVSSFEQKFLDI